jgi:hypothetical protein
MEKRGKTVMSASVERDLCVVCIHLDCFFHLFRNVYVTRTHVLRIPPLRRIFRAMPNDVGPKTAPAAMIPLVSPTLSM